MTESRNALLVATSSAERRVLSCLSASRFPWRMMLSSSSVQGTWAHSSTITEHRRYLRIHPRARGFGPFRPKTENFTQLKFWSGIIIQHGHLATPSNGLWLSHQSPAILPSDWLRAPAMLECITIPSTSVTTQSDKHYFYSAMHAKGYFFLFIVQVHSEYMTKTLVTLCTLYWVLLTMSWLYLQLRSTLGQLKYPILSRGGATISSA